MKTDVYTSGSGLARKFWPLVYTMLYRCTQIARPARQMTRTRPPAGRGTMQENNVPRSCPPTSTPRSPRSSPTSTTAASTRRERIITTPAERPHPHDRRQGSAQLLREQLPRPRRPPRDHRRRQTRARRMGLRAGQRAFHLRHAGNPQGTRSGAEHDSSARRTRSSIPSCFDANGGLFETILTAEDAVISDELNHASIIDGIRLCKAQRHRYKHNDMADLEAKLQAADGARNRLIATDGAFSMDGTIANLGGICDLAEKYDALVMFDDCHAAGFLGQDGARHARALRRDGPRGHHHRHARQGARRRERRLHERAQAGRRPAAAAVAAVPVFQHGRAVRGGGVAQGHRDDFRAPPNCATGWRKTRGISARTSRRSA